MGEGMMTVLFPWPPRELSPNSRVHWTKKHRATKAYKTSCWYACHAERPMLPYTYLNIKFSPPSARRADLDNMLASFKAGIDAISEVLGVDDSKFTITISKDKPVKGGCVAVEMDMARAIRPVRDAA